MRTNAGDIVDYEPSPKLKESSGAESGEDLSSVEASLSELMVVNEPRTPSLLFGPSLVSENLLKFYVEKGFFADGIARAPTGETTAPELAMGFRDF